MQFGNIVYIVAIKYAPIQIYRWLNTMVIWYCTHIQWWIIAWSQYTFSLSDRVYLLYPHIVYTTRILIKHKLFIVIFSFESHTFISPFFPLVLITASTKHRLSVAVESLFINLIVRIVRIVDWITLFDIGMIKSQYKFVFRVQIYIDSWIVDYVIIFLLFYTDIPFLIFPIDIPFPVFLSVVVRIS